MESVLFPSLTFPYFFGVFSSKSGLTSDPSFPLCLISQHTIYFWSNKTLAETEIALWGYRMSRRFVQ